MSEFSPSRREIRVPTRGRSLSAVVLEALEAMVIDGTLPAGSRINIEGLAREMEVSATPIREALAKLESTRLVESRQPGYFVAPMLTGPEFHSMYDMRLLLEPWAAARAAEITDDAGRARLRRELQAGGEEAPESGQWDAYLRVSTHDHRFHDLIAELSCNSWLQEALRRMNIHVHLLRIYWKGQMGTHALSEHQRICDAICTGEGPTASEAMRNHLISSRERIGKAFL